MSATNADWAAGYTERLGFGLAPIPPGLKHPTSRGWNRRENIITTKAAAIAHWSKNRSDGMAAVLDYSDISTLDIDHEVRAETILPSFGVDLPALKANGPCVVGQHYKLIFRKPSSVAIKHRTHAEPNEDDPRRSSVVFELRTGTISDTLPPTIHPKTGNPYYWLNSPRDGIPPVPARLLEIWLDWENFHREALKLCPWAPPPKETPPRKARTVEYSGPSVIHAFNAAHDATSILEAHGYQKKGKRFASPDATHDAGIVELESGKIFCHHAGDPLHSEHALDTFDVYRLLDHGGDFTAAIKTAARELGLNRMAT